MEGNKTGDKQDKREWNKTIERGVRKGVNAVDFPLFLHIHI